ncbi:MAG: hypothetical protein HC838_00905 [Spirulinaceae cyanobacterium RM2_2_10]|nr:hypothetical protein [Spirulinaceae cyanobacterium SM2_1_0]NJO18904.1 hypothetical protein [Spirulinaceae cyanobacterium RM2_2_10]
MDDWSQAWFDAIERVANDFEDFCTEIGENLEAIATELQTELTRDLESWLDEWMSQDWLGDESFAVTATFQLDLLDLDFSFDRAIADPEAPFAKRLAATAEHQPACVGCRHYHGYVYGGNLLVCGMHPYGWSGDICPDWQTAER